MNFSQTKLLKPLSVHEPTHQMQTFCEQKKSWDGTFKRAEELIVPPAGLPNLGFIKIHNAKHLHYQEELPKRCSSSELLGATEYL